MEEQGGGGGGGGLSLNLVLGLIQICRIQL